MAGAMAFLGTTGMLLQQTHADYYLVHGFPATRDFISVTPSLLEVASERLAATTRTILDNWRIVADRPGEAAEGGTAQAPAVRAGAPWPWQAADAAAPYTIVNLANGNLYTAIPIVSWQDVSFNLYHNSFDVDGLDTLSPGWTHSYSARLTFGADQVIY